MFRAIKKLSAYIVKIVENIYEDIINWTLEDVVEDFCVG